jgi:four helix bundle protein
MTIRSYADLAAWQKSMSLAESLYEATKSMPRGEMYGLTSQMRRAAVSVPSNIAEGKGRGTDGQLLRALGIAYGSLSELETQVILSTKLQFLNEADSKALLGQCAEVGRLLNGLMNSLDRAPWRADG